MKNNFLLTLTVLLLLHVDVAWALRCNRQLVSEGDYTMQVVQKSGEPDYTERRVEYRGTRLRGSGWNPPGLAFETLIPVNIDEWIYNFSPQQFVQLLVFQNGRLARIKDLD